jgi:hypothetical protein
MGRRTRKRGGLTTRAERDAARRAPAARRPAGSERPPAPWGSFPLSELVILLGIVVMVWGFLSGEDGGKERVAGGLLLASLGGGELALREHMAGYRSHSSLLAGAAAFVTVTAVALGLGPVKVWVLLVLGVGVFASTFYAMRELFKRRSGGLGFR